MSQDKRGLTRSELLIAIVAVAVLVWTVPILLVPFSSHGGELRWRSTCASNLNSIGKAMYLYAGTTNDEQLPRVAPFVTGADSGNWLRAGVRTDDGQNPMGRVAQGATEEEARENALDAMFNPKSTQPCSVGGSPTASLFILVRNGFLDAKALVCPSDPFGEIDELQEATVGTMVDLARQTNCSYSLAMPWGRNVDWTIDGHPRSVLAADLSPVGVSTDAQVRASGEEGNSRTHEQAGQNVLHRDSSVGWTSNSRVGIDGDNIFTVNTTGAEADAPERAPTLTDDGGGACLPRDKADSVMIFYGRESHPDHAGFGARWVLFIIPLAVIPGVVLWVWLARRRSRTQANETESI